MIKQVENDIRDFLYTNKSIFYNERDLQMHLALYLDKSRHYDNVDVEYYVPESVLKPEYVWDSEMKVDIVVSKDGNFVPIELKYKTKEIKNGSLDRFGKVCKGIQIVKNQAAQNLAKYDFWKDVRRIEILKSKFRNIEGGICLFLTNDQSYQKEPNNSAKCKSFSMSQGLHHRDKSWQGKQEKEIASRPNFKVEKEYAIKWAQTQNNDYYYTIISI